MPKLRDRIVSRGVNFSRSFCDEPVCCPARASHPSLPTSVALGAHGWGTPPAETFHTDPRVVVEAQQSSERGEPSLARLARQLRRPSTTGAPQLAHASLFSSMLHFASPGTDRATTTPRMPHSREQRSWSRRIAHARGRGIHTSPTGGGNPPRLCLGALLEHSGPVQASRSDGSGWPRPRRIIPTLRIQLGWIQGLDRDLRWQLSGRRCHRLTAHERHQKGGRGCAHPPASWSPRRGQLPLMRKPYKLGDGLL
jgi:hypothetical protein